MAANEPNAFAKVGVAGSNPVVRSKNSRLNLQVRSNKYSEGRVLAPRLAPDLAPSFSSDPESGFPIRLVSQTLIFAALAIPAHPPE